MTFLEWLVPGRSLLVLLKAHYSQRFPAPSRLQHGKRKKPPPWNAWHVCRRQKGLRICEDVGKVHEWRTCEIKCQSCLFVFWFLDMSCLHVLFHNFQELFVPPLETLWKPQKWETWAKDLDRLWLGDRNLQETKHQEDSTGTKLINRLQDSFFFDVFAPYTFSISIPKQIPKQMTYIEMLPFPVTFATRTPSIP